MIFLQFILKFIIWNKKEGKKISYIILATGSDSSSSCLEKRENMHELNMDVSHVTAHEAMHG